MTYHSLIASYEMGYMRLTPSLAHRQEAHADAFAERLAARPFVYVLVPTAYDTSIRNGDGHTAQDMERRASWTE